MSDKINSVTCASWWDLYSRIRVYLHCMDMDNSCFRIFITTW